MVFKTKIRLVEEQSTIDKKENRDTGTENGENKEIGISLRFSCPNKVNFHNREMVYHDKINGHGFH